MSVLGFKLVMSVTFGIIVFRACGDSESHLCARATAMLPLSLLVLGQGFGYPPPPPPGSACSYTPPEDPTITYDLSAIMALGTLPPISASSGTNSQFFVAVCQSVTRKCSSQECSTCDADP